MKKEKLKMTFTILTALVTLLLIANLYLESEESACYVKVEKMQNNIFELYFNEIELELISSSMHTRLLIANYTSIYIEKQIENKNAIVTSIDPSVKYITEKIFNITVDTQTNRTSLEEEMIIKRENCDNLSSNSKIALYAALVLSLVSIFVLYNLYKS